MVALCSYSLENLKEDEVVQVVVNHGIVLICRKGDLIAVGNSKSAKVRIMKDNGLSYAAIGNRIGVTRQRAHQILTKRKKQKKESQKLLTTSGVASLLNIHVNTVRHWSDKGILTSYRIGSRGDRRFRWEDIVNLVSVRASAK
jgi:excisionase family DNA binding protein